MYTHTRTFHPSYVRSCVHTVMINAALVLRHCVSACEFSNSSWEFVTYMCLCCLRNPTDAGTWLTHTLPKFYNSVWSLNWRNVQVGQTRKESQPHLFFFFFALYGTGILYSSFSPSSSRNKTLSKKQYFFSLCFFRRCFLHFFFFFVCCVYSFSFLRFKKMSCLSNEELPRAPTSCVASESLKNGH